MRDVDGNGRGPLTKAIRAAALEQDISLEALRGKARMSADLFYRLLRGEEPRKLDSLRRLQHAGVRIPENVI